MSDLQKKESYYCIFVFLISIHKYLRKYKFKNQRIFIFCFLLAYIALRENYFISLISSNLAVDSVFFIYFLSLRSVQFFFRLVDSIVAFN